MRTDCLRSLLSVHGVQWLALLAYLTLAPSLPAADGLLDWRKLVGRAEGEESQARAGGEWEMQKGTLELYDKMPEETKLICHYAVPVSKNGRPSPRAGETVYYFHTPGDRDPLAQDICKRLVCESGVNVFSIAFGKSSDSGYFYNPAQRNRFYAFNASGSFAAIKEAWGELRARLRLDASRFFLYGYSAGGIGVQGFAEYYPQFTAGVVSVCGHSFVQKRGATCPFLVIHTYGDGGVPDGEGLSVYCERIGAPCIRLLFNPNWGLLRDGKDFSFHSVHPSVAPLAQRFIEAVVDARREQKSETPDLTKSFPYVVDLNDPRQVSVASGEAMERFAKAGGRPAAIPSARFFAEMIRNQLATRTIDDPQHGKVLYSLPAVDRKPQGMVAMWWSEQADRGRPSGRQPKRMECDLRYATERDMAGIAALSGVKELSFARSKAIEEFPGMAALPQHLIAFDPLEEDIAELASLTKLTSVVIAVSSSTMLRLIVPELKKFTQRNLKVSVIVCAPDQKSFDAVLADFPAAGKSGMFKSFIYPKEFEQSLEDYAVHQRVLEQAFDMLVARKL